MKFVIKRKLLQTLRAFLNLAEVESENDEENIKHLIIEVRKAARHRLHENEIKKLLSICEDATLTVEEWNDLQQKVKEIPDFDVSLLIDPIDLEIRLDNAPKDFQCPVSYTIMLMPIIVLEGDTYCLSSFKGMVNSGRTIRNPLTNEDLSLTGFTVNKTLYSQIKQWCEENDLLDAWIERQQEARLPTMSQVLSAVKEKKLLHELFVLQARQTPPEGLVLEQQRTENNQNQFFDESDFVDPQPSLMSGFVTRSMFTQVGRNLQTGEWLFEYGRRRMQQVGMAAVSVGVVGMIGVLNMLVQTLAALLGSSNANHQQVDHDHNQTEARQSNNLFNISPPIEEESAEFVSKVVILGDQESYKSLLIRTIHPGYLEEPGLVSYPLIHHHRNIEFRITDTTGYENNPTALQDYLGGTNIVLVSGYQNEDRIRYWIDKVRQLAPNAHIVLVYFRPNRVDSRFTQEFLEQRNDVPNRIEKFELAQSEGIMFFDFNWFNPIEISIIYFFNELHDLCRNPSNIVTPRTAR